MGSIHAIELSNLNFKMVKIHFCLSLHRLLSKLLQSSLYVAQNFGLSLMRLINCYSKFLKMVLSPLRNRIKRRDHWTLKHHFNNIHFSGSSYHSTHVRLPVICRSNHSVLFCFLSEKTFLLVFMELCGCKYVYSCNFCFLIANPPHIY